MTSDFFFPMKSSNLLIGLWGKVTLLVFLKEVHKVFIYILSVKYWLKQKECLILYLLNYAFQYHSNNLCMRTL